MAGAPSLLSPEQVHPGHLMTSIPAAAAAAGGAAAAAAAGGAAAAAGAAGAAGGAGVAAAAAAAAGDFHAMLLASNLPKATMPLPERHLAQRSNFDAESYQHQLKPNSSCCYL